MACVLPLHAVASNSLTISSRQRTEAFCFWTVPCAFRTEIAAVDPFHSIRPSHKDSGGLSGSVSPISYRQAFWLLDPEFSTRTFIASNFTPLFDEATDHEQSMLAAKYRGCLSLAKSAAGRVW